MGIKEIAEKAGVSKTTVSLALNGHKGVSDETRSAILKLAKEMDYRVPCERSYEQVLQGNIVFAKLSKHGLILNEDQHHFIVNYIEGIHQVVKEYGYSFEIITQRIDAIETFIADINKNHPKGIIVLGTELKPEEVSRLSGLQVPYLVLDTYFEQLAIDFVSMGNIGAVHNLVGYLVKKHHRDIFMVTSSVPTGNISMRERGFRQALEHFDLPYSSESLIPVEPGFKGAYRDMLSYLKDRDRLPQAFFCFNDVAAFGVIKALKDCGYRVPEDISIIGFDDLLMSQMMEPRLTSVHIPTQLIGSIAARSLIERIVSKTHHVPKGVLIHGELIVRESVLDRK